MPTKSDLLAHLTRDEIIALVERFDLPVADRRVKAQLIDAATRLPVESLASHLGDLSRDRLKELCRAVGFDDGGREKLLLIERLIPSRKSPARKTTAGGRSAATSSSAAQEPPPPRTGSGPQQIPLPLTSSPKITLSVLESHLWEAANILRGSPVDRTDWKSFILPLLFFKRICDVWDEEHASMLVEFGADYPDQHRFQIPEGCHWNDVRGVAKNVGTALQNAMRGLESANHKHLYGVFGDGQWSNKDRLPDELLKDLIEHFSALTLGNAHVNSDLMGDAYEYLIKQFADATNKKAGEFYTPRSVVRLMVDILDPKEGETIYDPACGTGGMLLAAVAHVREAGGDPRTFFGHLYGQEKNLTTASVARMNLFLHGLEDFQIERGDTLRNPVFTDAATGGLAKFDVVLANPPFGLAAWGREEWNPDPWGRPFGTLAPSGCSDFAWVQHMVASLAKAGRMAVVLPIGALFRDKAGEDSIRQYLLERDFVDAVIGLAPNLFYGTSLAACILVLRKKKKQERRGQVLLIEASDLHREERSQNHLDGIHAQEIRRIYHGFSDVPGRARVVSVGELAKAGWSLNISRYILPPGKLEIQPLPDAMRQLKTELTRCRDAEAQLRKALIGGGWIQ